MPLFIAAAAIPMSQRIVIFGADFTMLRILIVAYFARVMIRGEFRSIGWNRLDTAMLLWSICGTMVWFLAHGSLDVLVSRLGQSFDMLGIYFVSRFLIRSWSDVKFVGKALAVLSLPVAVLFAVEWATALQHVLHFRWCTGRDRGARWATSVPRCVRASNPCGHVLGCSSAFDMDVAQGQELPHDVSGRSAVCSSSLRAVPARRLPPCSLP